MDLKEKTGNLRRHPWELSRTYSILRLMPKSGNLVYADIGAGDRYFTSKLLHITNGDVFAVDSEYKEKRTEQDGIICLNDSSLIKSDSIDYLVMMDVLEHIENETIFLGECLDKLKPNGKVIITVPAMQFLFSSHDLFLKHYRRYSRKQLLSLLRKHNMCIEQSYYFYSTLFIIRCFSSLFEKFKPKEVKINSGIGLWGYDEESIITRSLVFILNMDYSLNEMLNKIHIRLPGLSLIAVCRKNS